MDQGVVTRGRTWSWGYPASVFAHALILALVIFGLPVPAFEPEAEEAIAVAVVPPPEEAEPAPEPEDVPEPEAEAPPPPPENAEAEEADAASRIAALRPVVRFGESDAGPRDSRDGAAETEEPAAEEQGPERVEEAAAAAEPPLELELPDGAAVPVPTPAPRASDRPVAAKRLLSPAATGALVATTAIGNLPRGRRAGELCATELREQLRHGTPAYWPELLPTYQLDTGTRLEVRQSAFRADAAWYDLSFTCEIDADATRVVSFALDVGAPVPRSEWHSRGFPEI